MKNIIFFLIAGLITCIGYSQTHEMDSFLKETALKKDSTLKALYRADSIKVARQYEEQEMIAKFSAVAIYPILNAGPLSGVVPVENPTEIPDPKLEYKLLFELVQNIPESISGLDASLVEVARVLNLHVAAGIPAKRISPVIVVHGPALNAFATNEFYHAKFGTDNPNLKLISELEALGTRFIACGQAMFFFGVHKEALLPLFKVSLTAQTVLSSYQLKGYVLNKIEVDR